MNELDLIERLKEEAGIAKKTFPLQMRERTERAG